MYAEIIFVVDNSLGIVSQSVIQSIKQTNKNKSIGQSINLVFSILVFNAVELKDGVPSDTVFY